jgi:uncharacterized protein YaaN involved in tellurite resistance
MSDEITQPTPAGAIVPTAPNKLAEAERDELVDQARDLAAQVTAAPEDRSLSRRLGSLGGEAQQKAGAQIELLKTKVGTLMKDLDGPGAKIPEGLGELRKTMDSINPHSLMEQPKGFFSRLLRRAPVIGDVLADVAIRYESVQTQIDVIVGSLRAGKDELLSDSLELDRLYEQVRDAQLAIQKSAYMGELLWDQLERQKTEMTDPADRQKIDTVTHRVAMRVQDLRTMEQVNTQFFVSIDMTIQNNDHLSDAITRTVTVTQSLLTVGLAIQSALANQKKIMGAVQKTQEYTSDMLAANAASIRQQTNEIGDLYTNPVLAMDKVKAAYDDLMGAMDEMDAIRKTGTESAREGIAQLNAMTAELAPRAEGLRAAGAVEIPDAAGPDLSVGAGEGGESATDSQAQTQEQAQAKDEGERA